MIKMRKYLHWRNLYIVMMFVLLYLPIFYLIGYSFSDTNTMAHFQGFTLQHYHDLFNDTRLWQIVLATLLVALLSSLIATIIGTLGALWISRTSRSLARNTLLSFNNILMVSPDVIIGASLLIFFTCLHVQLGFWTVLLSHIAFSVPIVVLMVLPKLDEMESSMLDAAADLGANDWQALTRVVLPALTSSILAGFFMAFTYSLDDFAVTFFVTGNGFETLSIEIYSRARQGISLEINALSGILFIFALVLVIGYYFVSLHTQRKHNKSR